MKKKDVEIGGLYIAKVSGSLVVIRLDRESPFGGWDATNLTTKRMIRIRTAARLRQPAKIRAKSKPLIGWVDANSLPDGLVLSPREVLGEVA